MDVVFYLIGALCFFLAFFCQVVVLMEAFRKSMKLGLLCFFLPPFTWFYYVFKKFEHPRKKLVVVGGYICFIVSTVCFMVAPILAESDAPAQSDSLEDWDYE